MNALEIKNMTKRYGEHVAVDNISLEIKKGEFFGFLGPNGAGKTTTIKAVTGIGTYDEGDIRVFGIDVTKDYREARKKIGLSSQDFNVDIFQPVEKTLWFAAGYYGIPRSKRKAHIEEKMKLFELIPHAKKAFKELSGGLKRRTILARAMIHDPDLLILDEPTAGVDVELRRELWKYLQRINKEGKTILLTSHYLEEVEHLCNRIAIINEGTIVAVGDKKDFVKEGSNLEKKYLEIIGKAD